MFANAQKRSEVPGGVYVEFKMRHKTIERNIARRRARQLRLDKLEVL